MMTINCAFEILISKKSVFEIALYYIAKILHSDSRNGFTMAITISIMPIRKSAISGYRLHNIGLIWNVMMARVSITGKKRPAPMRAPPKM